MEGAKDPDEYIIKYGSAGFNKLVENAISLVEFKVKILKQTLDTNNVTDKIKFLNQIAKVLSNINNKMEKEIYIDKISKEYKISKEAIFAEVNKLKYGNVHSKNILELSKARANIHIPKEEKLTIDDKKENFILRLLITAQYKAYKELSKEIEPNEFRNEINKKIITKLYEKYAEINSDIEDILSLFEEEEIINKLSAIMAEDYGIIDVDKCILDILKNHNQDKLLLNRNEIIEKLRNKDLSQSEINELENELSNILIKIAQSK